jgi:hypothetical protein
MESKGSNVKVVVFYSSAAIPNSSWRTGLFGLKNRF